ncbi:PilN domain-containing protein [Anabaena sp. FACHB-1237]|uniref:PilN domain-containing protein n=1 Tax=Anabaena sp. FACHB-1237 TaxID=2692769 RepID=UPI0016800B29|nr:PilN domain-containing protein [Anabaena sp. FACHB-1237]MBD2138398.1 PilN domain-containing protein [Anabaena sp. FACHB-1237]
MFDHIRPWSAMLQDLRDRIPPRVQIESIRQVPPTPVVSNNNASIVNNPGATAGTLEISGYARSYADVNDFSISIGKSSFINIDETNIKSAELIDAPEITGFVVVKDEKPGSPGGKNVKIKTPKVIKYTIKAGLSTTPATELLQELEKKGATGLGIRLRNIENTGRPRK